MRLFALNIQIIIFVRFTFQYKPQETADLVTFTKKSSMESFIFCAVSGTENELD